MKNPIEGNQEGGWEGEVIGGYFNNIIKELRVEDRTDFRDMFRMDVADFEYILTQISYLICQNIDMVAPIQLNATKDLLLLCYYLLLLVACV